MGCNGGWYARAFAYLKNNSATLEDAYTPYTAQDGTCSYDVTKAADVYV